MDVHGGSACPYERALENSGGAGNRESLLSGLPSYRAIRLNPGVPGSVEGQVPAQNYRRYSALGKSALGALAVMALTHLAGDTEAARYVTDNAGPLAPAIASMPLSYFFLRK
jgi:hypothetical protein